MTSVITGTNTKTIKLNDFEKLFVFMKEYNTKDVQRSAKHKTKKSYTHTMLYAPYGNYCIPDNMQEKFMELYENAIIAGHSLSIAEKPKEFGPIIIEIIFVQKQKEKCYTEMTLKDIVMLYNEIIKKNINVESNHIDAFVSEIKTPILKRKEEYNDNIHIMYPYIFTKSSIQTIMMNEFIKSIKESNILQNIPFVNELDEIINKQVITGNWLMYGSKKNTLTEAHKLTHIYDTINGNIHDALVPGENSNKQFIQDVIKTLSIRKFLDENKLTPLKKINGFIPGSKMNDIESESPNKLFGTEKNNYSVDKLKNLIREGNIEGAKEYVRKYFIKIGNPPGILWWAPSEKRMIHYKFDEVKTLYIPSIQNGNFDIRKWFFQEETTVFLQDIAVSQPIIYEKCKQPYINLFPGYKHKTYHIFDDYSADIKSKVKLIWDHIELVWCSNQEELFNYNKSWICFMVAGKKMTTCLYLKSGQGTGKSIITEFLQSNVLGNNIVYITSNPDCIYSFNQQLSGKVLLILEELPALNKNQWCTVSNSLKHLITGKTYTVKEKHKSDFEATNNISIIISSNNNAIRIEADDRRFVIDDISHEKVGDHNYFKKLVEATNNDIVGEAFYWYCIEYTNKHKDFKEFPPPLSNTKKDLIVENLHSLFEYVKEEYIKNQQDIDIKFSDFYDNYIDNQKTKKLDPPSKIAVGKLLNIHKLGFVEGNANVRYVKITARKLYDVYNTKHWIHDIDDIHPLYQ